MKHPTLETCRLLKEANWSAPHEKVWAEKAGKWMLVDNDVAVNGNGLPAPDTHELFSAIPKFLDKEDAYLSWDGYFDDGEPYGWPNYESIPGPCYGPEGHAYRYAPLIEQLALLWIWVKKNYPESLPK